jgi:Uma2 family endonuclease
MTLQEYLATPETVAPHELIFGALRVADSPSPAHQATVASLFLALHDHVSARSLGTVWFTPLDVILDAERALVVQPDSFFIAPGRARRSWLTKFAARPIVIEVLSPKPRVGDVEERVSWFPRLRRPRVLAGAPDEAHVGSAPVRRRTHQQQA